MPLTTRTNGSAPSNIVAASWWNDYKDLLTGVMADQAVNINNSVNVASLITTYGKNYGYYIQDSFGAPQPVMHYHTDGDLHLIPSPVNNKLRITKSTYAYDLAVFDASGSTGATTFNGALSATTVNCTILNATNITAGAISPTSITTGTLTANAVVATTTVGAAAITTGTLTATGTITADTFTAPHLNLSGPLAFTGGTWAGGIRIGIGGALELSGGIGGAAGINLYTGNFSTYIAGMNNVGGFGVPAFYSDTFFDSLGGSHVAITKGTGGVTALQDATRLSLQVPAGTERASVTSAATTINGTLTVGSSLSCNNIVDSTGVGHLVVTTGGGGLTRLADPSWISFQVPGGTEQASMTASLFTVNNPTTINGASTVNGTFTVNGDSKLTGQLYFTGGNNGSLRNTAGGGLDLSAGGTGHITFYNNLFGTNIGNIDDLGQLTVTTVKSNSVIDTAGVGHLVTTPGVGGVTRLADSTKLSLQVPGATERFWVSSTDVHSNLTFTAPAVRFGLGGVSKLANGSFYVTSGTTTNQTNPLGNVNIRIAICGANNQTVIWVPTVTASTITFTWTGAAPYNVNWFAYVDG